MLSGYERDDHIRLVIRHRPDDYGLCFEFVLHLFVRFSTTLWVVREDLFNEE